MPVSHKHKLIFIHIPKNGGKSFEISFGFYKNQTDSINRRSLFNNFFKLLLNKTSNSDANNMLIGVGDKSFALQHLTLQEMILLNFVDEKILEDYKIATIVRDPYDRAFSLFNHWMLNKYSIENVEELFHAFLSKIPEYRKNKRHNVSAHFRQQVDYLRNIKGEIKNINILRLENINKDLIDFSNSNNLENVINISSLNSFKKESSSLMRIEANSERNRILVEKFFPDDLDFFSTQ